MYIPPSAEEASYHHVYVHGDGSITSVSITHALNVANIFFIHDFYCSYIDRGCTRLHCHHHHLLQVWMNEGDPGNKSQQFKNSVAGCVYLVRSLASVGPTYEHSYVESAWR